MGSPVTWFAVAPGGALGSLGPILARRGEAVLTGRDFRGERF